MNGWYTTSTSTGTTTEFGFADGGSFYVRFQQYAPPPPPPPQQISVAQILQVFGLTEEATADAVRRAYRRLAFEYHPDRGGDAEKMAIINRAYDILKESGRV